MDDVFWINIRSEKERKNINNIDHIVSLREIQYKKKISLNEKIKNYVRPGEECSICLELILTNKTSYILKCNHSFHEKCIKEYGKKLDRHLINCPLCRLPNDINKERFRYRYTKENNHMDYLEDFWNFKDYLIPKKCRNKNHYVGMESKCKMCKKYRELGYCYTFW